MSATCGHVTCARREHLVAVLIKCALDGASELDSLKAAAASDPHEAPISTEERDRLQQVVERIYDACEQLGIDVATGKAQVDEIDPLYDQAVRIVVNGGRASISRVQRELRIGYNHAARLLETMEKSGVITSANSEGLREIIK